MSLLGVCESCRNEVSSEAHRCPHCGQPNPFDRSAISNADIARKTRAVVSDRGKVEAIKFIHDATNSGLKKAKDFVEFL